MFYELCHFQLMIDFFWTKICYWTLLSCLQNRWQMLQFWHFSLNLYVWNILIGCICCVQHIRTWFLPFLGKKKHMYFWNVTVTQAHSALWLMKRNHSYVYQMVLHVNNYPYLITGYLITKNEWKRFFLLTCMSKDYIYSPK